MPEFSVALRSAILPSVKEVPAGDQREEHKESFLRRQMLSEKLAHEARVSRGRSENQEVRISPPATAPADAGWNPSLL